ncbi:MAG: pyrroline-5-carboxylate reductase [Clostridia bacterium]|nr:pyrroline-5-carboxylate reductase [Clostridia bacterium]MBR0537111.1 pyrroline-5-carboxylate reductase [Clostridia bacterium]
MFNAGFIGAGNMGGALLHAVAKTGASVGVFDTDPAKVAGAQKEGAAFADAKTLAAESELLFLAVKPNVILGVCREIAPALSAQTVLVTMAAGVALSDVAAAAGTRKVIRIMPNTPVAVGAGLILYCSADAVSKEEEARFSEILRYSGKLDPIDEKNIDAAAALSGCGPAFVYPFAEALADGAVRCGVPRAKAMEYAAATILGSAEMLLKSGRHPGELKDAVCSPGGTTIEGVLTLERAGFRAAAADAVIAAYEKTKKLK